MSVEVNMYCPNAFNISRINNVRMVAGLTVARTGQQIGRSEGWAILPAIIGIWLSVI